PATHHSMAAGARRDGPRRPTRAAYGRHRHGMVNLRDRPRRLCGRDQGTPVVRGAVTVALFVCGCAFRQPLYAADIDWSEVEKQATEFLSSYIQIDTSNPPGNETAAARFLAEHFHQAGIDAEVFESAPGRGSVLARLQ